MKHTIPLLLLALASALLSSTAQAEIPPIKRLLPPEGIEIPAEVRSRLEKRLKATKERLETVSLLSSAIKDRNTYWDDEADIAIFTKAVEYALLHREFYSTKDFEKADWALDQANSRMDAIERREAPWTKATGLVVRGYHSYIDDSVQPYGLVIPKDHDFTKPCPLYVWLHGRGDKNTDLHFLYERSTKIGQIAPSGAIVVHPFGRQCVGYKSVGEIDVLSVVHSTELLYKIDRPRIVLMGFSMGGAGAWHVGAHRAPQWVAVSPGAGFAETARYQRLTPDKYPPEYEQKLWGLYDVPNYVRNLFNTEVIAYSGENDKQIQAARVMEEAFEAEGRKLTHLIGPGVEHKYEPKTLAELMSRLDAVVAKGRGAFLSEVHLQTRTLRYHNQSWVWAEGLEEHWLDSRIDAVHKADQIEVKTKNISSLMLAPPPERLPRRFVIDGQEISVPLQQGQRFLPLFAKADGKWKRLASMPTKEKPRKEHGLQGPIDDVFNRHFLVITPTGKSKNPPFQEWVEFELQHFRDRWRALMRADLPEKKDVDVNPDDIGLFQNVILWGDPDSNSMMAKMLEATPVKFADGKWRFGEQEYDGNRFVPALIYPYSYHEKHYLNLVLNSGLTFREGHDRTNSLQNPKLPDWAIIDITQKPDAFAPGRIHDAGFFDEEWKLKAQPKGP